MLKSRKFVTLLAPFYFVSCASVPDDAPQEFFEAKQAINKMEKNESDEVMPKTTERANIYFDEALDELDKAHDKGSTEIKNSAISKAIKARDTASGATQVANKVRQWDNSQESFLAALEELERPEQQAATEPEQTPKSTFTKLAGSEFVSTLAYYNTGESDKALVNEPELKALIALLEKDKDFQVILTGYADPRGAEEFNEKLALNRAKNMAQKLQNQGVSGDQIIVKSAGEAESEGEEGDMASLQLDRKVRGKLILRNS